MRFDLTTPCGNCPFRNDRGPFGLRADRVREILGGGKGKAWWPAPSFVCHKTVDYSPPYTISDAGVEITCKRCGYTSHNLNDVENRYCGECHLFLDDENYVGPDAQQCAGVMLILHREKRPNDAMQLAERMRLWDPSKLAADAPVYASTEDAIEGVPHARDHGDH